MTIKTDEKKCQHCAEVIKRDANVCRFCNRELTGQSAKRGAGGKRGGGMLIGLLVLFALAGYVYWAPFGTLQEIRHDLRNGQADKLDQIIDYTAVREGLKRDFRALALGEVEDDPSIKNKLLGVLGLALGAPVVDPVVDYVVSPAGLRDVVAGGVPVLSRHSPFGSAPDSSGTATPNADSDNGKKTDCRYYDMNEFIATISSKTGSSTALTFSRRGLLSWQLTHIKLMPAHD